MSATNVMTEGIPFKKFIEHLMQEVIRADAEMQLLQRSGWIGLNKGFPLAEGLDINEFLGLNEVKMTFWVELAGQGMWVRFKRWLKSLLGKPELAAKGLYRLMPGELGGKSGFKVSISVSRGTDRTYKIESEPAADKLGGVYVTDIFS